MNSIFQGPQPPQVRTLWSEEEYTRRHNAAKDEEQRTLAPYIKWLCDTDIMFAKVTIVQKLDGTIEITKEYPPEVQAGVDAMTAMMRAVSAAIWAYHFPGRRS